MNQNTKQDRWIMFVATVVAIIGIWYALPQTGIVYDEFFPGGVLRSLSDFSLIPHSQDILYGTLTFYIDYIFIIILLVLTLPFVHFEIASLKVFMLQNIHLAYLSSRLVSAICFVLCVYIFLKICRMEKMNTKAIAYSILIVFGSIIFLSTFHTTKVWPLSILLLMTSLFFTYRFILEKNKKDSFLSILFSFLSFANFPLMGFSLISIPIALFISRKDKILIRKILLYSFFGFLIFCIISILNISGISAQVQSILFDYTLSSTAIKTNVSIVHSFGLNLLKLGNLYTVLILALLVSVLSHARIRSKRLFILGLIYGLTYLICISIVARWSTDLHSYLRYLLPLGIFLGMILISLDFKMNIFHYFLATVSFIYLVKIILLLSVPTTANEMYIWVNENLNHENITIVRDSLSNVQLPSNKLSMDNLKDEFCGAICQGYRQNQIVSSFKPLLITEQSDLKILNTVNAYKVERYLVSGVDLPEKSNQKIKTFFNGKKRLDFVADLEQIGNYLDFGIFSLISLGPDIYVYKIR